MRAHEIGTTGWVAVGSPGFDAVLARISEGAAEYISLLVIVAVLLFRPRGLIP